MMSHLKGLQPKTLTLTKANPARELIGQYNAFALEYMNRILKLY